MFYYFYLWYYCSKDGFDEGFAPYNPLLANQHLGCDEKRSVVSSTPSSPFSNASSSNRLISLGAIAPSNVSGNAATAPPRHPLQGHTHQNYVNPTSAPIMFYNIPLGVFMQMFLLVRLMVSCFVGHWEMGTEIRCQAPVLKYVCRRMWTTLILAMPYQVIAPMTNCSLYLILFLFLLNFLFAFRWIRILNDFAFVERYLGPLYNLFCFILYAFCLDSFFAFIWWSIPFLGCYTRGEMTNNRIHIHDCINDDCTLRVFKFPECMDNTWLPKFPRTLPPVPVMYNGSIKFGYYSPKGNHVPLLLADLHVFASFRTVGLSMATAASNSEFFLSTIIIFLGYYLFNWKLSGLMQMYYLEKELHKTEYRTQLSIIETYCDFHRVCPRSRLRMRKFLDLKFLWDRDLFNSDAFRAVPDEYRNRIVAATVLSALEKVRLFRGIPIDNLMAISNQFRTKLFIRGQTIKRPGEAASGLMLLRRGVIVVISMEDGEQGSIVKLERGDYFGEINLLLPHGTPLLILAATDCEVWMLQTAVYSELSSFFTGAVKSRLLFNLKSIMDATVCVFHEEYDIFAPRNLKKHVQEFITGDVEDFPMHLFGDESKDGHSNPRPKLHNESTKYKIWSFVAAAVGLLAIPICFNYTFPADILDVIWPANPYSLYLKCRPHDDFEGCSHWEWAYSLLLWIMSFICIADCVIWFCIGIVSPYGVISGRDATKQKFRFTELGASTLAKIVSTLSVAFKLLRFRDVAKYLVPLSFNIHIFTVSMAFVVIILCYYTCRLFLIIRKLTWERGEFCESVRGVWGKDREAVKRTIDRWCVETFQNENCRRHLTLLEDPRFGQEEFFAKHYQVPDYLIWAQSLSILCERNKTITPSLERFFTSLYVFYDFASTQGSGNIVNFWGVDKTLLQLLKWVTDTGLLISAAMAAKITARNLGYQLARIVFQTHQKSLKEAMTMRSVPPYVQSHLLHYMENACNTYNRITMAGSASMLTAIPSTLKSTKHHYDSFVGATSFFLKDADLSGLLFSQCKHYIYPPGCLLTACGSVSDIFLFIITQGYVQGVDTFGCKQVKGPGDVLSLTSFWVNEHYATAVSMTHVKAIVLDEKSLTNSLKTFPRVMRSWINGYKFLHPILQSSLDENSEFIQKKEVHDKAVDALVEKARRQDYHKTYNQRRRGKWHKYLFLHRSFFLTTRQFCVAIFIFGGVLHSASAFLATLQSVFLISTPGLNYAGALMDALVLLELYLRIHLVWVEEDRFITCPAAIGMRTLRRDWFHILAKFPLEIFVIPFRSAFSTPQEFQMKYLQIRGFRGFRFLETFRRIFAIRQQFSINVQISTWISCVFHILVHIHIMAILWFAKNCSPTYVIQGNHKYSYCKEASWTLRMYDERTNFHNGSEKGIFSYKLHDKNNFGSLFTEKEMSCIIDKCPPVISSKYDMYLVSGSANRMLGESVDEFSINFSFIELTECYSLAIYWAAQTLTLTGFGDMSIASLDELFFFYIFFLTSIIHGTYITAKIVGVHISYDPDENEAFAEKAETHSYLVSKAVPTILIKKVTRAKEMHQAFHIDILPRESKNLPRILFSQVRYNICLPMFKVMLLTEACSHGQLGLLSALLEEKFVPQGDFIVRRGEVVDGIFIIADGSARFVNEEESVEDSVLPGETPEDRRMTTGRPSWSLYRSTLNSRSLEGVFDSGCCFGIDISTRSKVPLMFWHYNILARHNCRLYYLDGKLMQIYRENLEPALAILGQQVTNTKDEIKLFRRLSNSPRHLNQDWKEKRLSFAVFHPTNSVLNVVLICGHSVKLFCILLCFSLAVYVGKIGPYPDPQLPFQYIRPNYFVTLYVLLLSLSYACVVLEIVLKRYTGYIEKGRTIMDEALIRHHYRTKSLLLTDLFSLVPTPYLYLLNVETFDQFFHRYSSSVIVLFVPQMIQIYRTVMYFTLPRQAEPLSAVIMYTKTVMRITLVISAFIVCVSLLLIFTSCSEFQTNCRYTWIEFAHKTYVVTSNMDIMSLSVYFTITILVTTGYGDLTGHRVLERYTLTLIMALCMVVVAICQARITTSLFKIAARSRMYSDRIEKLRMALEANQVKATVIDQVTGYLRVAYGHHGGKQLQTLLKDLHPSLRKQVHYVICQDFIRQLPYFHDLPMGLHQYVTLFVDAAFYLPGDVIVGRGDVVSAAYFISEGEASLRPPHRSVVEIKQGSAVFRDCLVTPQVAKASLVAESLTIVYFLEYDDFSRIIHSLSDVAEEQCTAKTWSRYYTAMKQRYGDHKVYKGLAMDRATFHLSETFALLQNDIKCQEKLKIDRTNSEHAGYQLTFVPNDDVNTDRNS